MGEGRSWLLHKGNFGAHAGLLPSSLERMHGVVLVHEYDSGLLPSCKWPSQHALAGLTGPHAAYQDYLEDHSCRPYEISH